MKKILTIIMLCFLLTACSSGNISTLNYKELSAKLNAKETFILVINDGSDNSKLLKKTLNNVLETYNIKAYEVNSKKIKDDEINQLRDKITISDCSIVFVKEGIEPSKLSNIYTEITNEDEIINRLTDMGYIKKTIN